MPSNKKGIPNDSFTLNIDLAETILGAAGIKADDNIMQGRDIADLYLPDRPSTSKEPWRTEWYYEVNGYRLHYALLSLAGTGYSNVMHYYFYTMIL